MKSVSEKVVSRKLEIKDILPKEWLDSNGQVSVMQSVYACLFFSPARMNPPYIAGKIGDVFYLICEAEIDYHSALVDFQGLNSGGMPSIEVKVQEKKTPSGTYIMFFTKYKEGGEISENEALSKLESARGLINASEGLNATYLHMFNQTLVLPKGDKSFASPVLLNPHSMPHPFVDLGRLPRLATGLEQVDPSTKMRVMLALRWLDKSDRETDPLDAFLKTWFALEVLSMPDDTNIRPLIEVLGKIYGMSYSESQSHFQIGKIYGLRSDIVHNGRIKSIHQQLHRYMRAVFVDVLLDLTKQPSEKRAEQVLNDTTFAHKDWRP